MLVINKQKMAEFPFRVLFFWVFVILAAMTIWALTIPDPTLPPTLAPSEPPIVITTIPPIN